ncbi:MAG: lysylphosphatidylglycerol synthase transmembrane domain-containing protein, partial [Candidatus Omnitrophica bacterium]|nr:lysylphosphatidylglycerol synthase transmembrane domain-containing protein [Candidatus Omnitrophota bacterium]
MKERVKKTLSFVLRFGLSAGLLVYLFQKNDITKTIEIAKSADIFYLFIALLIMFTIYGLLLLRWRIVMKALNLHVAKKESARWFWIGTFFNFVLPTSTGGDVVKAIGLCKGMSDRAKVVASIVLDRIFGFISITIVALISYFVARKMADEKSLLNGILILFVISWGGLLFLLNERLYSFSCTLFNKFASIKAKLLKLHQAFVLIKGRFYPIFLTIAVSSFGQVLLGFSYFFTAKGLHQDADLIYCIAFAPLICVASSLPSIGGLGFRENATALLFMKIGLTKPAAVSISLLNLLYIVIVGFVGAIVYVCSVFSRRVQRGQSDAASGAKG